MAIRTTDVRSQPSHVTVCGVRCILRASFARLVRCIARLANEPGVFKVRALHYYSTSLVCEPRSFLQCEPRLRASHTLLCEPRRWLSFASLVCEPSTPYITSLVTEAFFASLANEPLLANEPFARLGRRAVWSRSLHSRSRCPLRPTRAVRHRRLAPA